MRGLLKGKARGGRDVSYYRKRLEKAEIGLLKGKARGGREERITKGKS